MNNLQTYEEYLNEESIDIKTHADNFISDYLKLGTKKNLFDAYMRKAKMNPEDLSIFVAAVAERIKEKWA